MRFPRLRADYLPVVVGDGEGTRLFLLSEARRLLVDDPVTADLAGLLDGERDVGALAAALDGRHDPFAVLRAVRKLDALDVLAEGPATVPAAAAAGWDALGIDPAVGAAGPGEVLTARTAPPGTAVTVEGLLEGLGVATRAVALEALASAPTGPGALPAVVVVDSVLDPRLAVVNAAMLAAGRGWVLVRPRGAVAMLGPHFAPGQTGCWECLRQRWEENEQLENYLARARPDLPRPAPAQAELPGTAAVLAGLLATELAVLAARGTSPRLTGRLVAYDALAASLGTHTLVRQPQCPACGDPDLLRKADPAVVLTARPAGTDGRAAPPAETAARLAHHVSPYLGVVTHLTPVGDQGNGVTFAYAAGHNFALGRDVDLLRRTLRGQSGGKGRSDAAAKAGALGEAIERYCGLWRSDRPTHRASFGALGAGRAVPLRDLLGFSDAQYAGRERTNAHAGPFQWVPRPVGDDVELDWTTAWSLTHARAVDLPAAFCWYGHPEAAGLEACAADSNGSAAGASLEEAILQGFCEIVERDAVALWWYHRSRLPGVDLAAFGDRWADDAVAHHARVLGRRLWALDLTSDLGIPVFAGVSARVGTDGPEDIILGFGAHLDPAVALTRALAEVNQFIPLVSTRRADGSTAYGLNDPESLRWFTTARVAEQPWLTPDPALPATGPGTHRRPEAAGDLAGAVGHCVAAAGRAGLEVLVVNQSRPDLELAVAKVVVPGARHFWRRLGPGRLWDVPVALGRLPVAGDESSVNPYSVFF